MRVYHGSDHIIKEPRYLGGTPDNDYGNGFYTTEYEDRARSWATLNGNPEKSIVNIYELDMEHLKVLDLNEQGVLAWIAEVIGNRGTSQEVEKLFYKGPLGNQIFLKSCEIAEKIKPDELYSKYYPLHETSLENGVEKLKKLYLENQKKHIQEL